MQALREALEHCSSTLNQGSPARTRHQLQALVHCLLLTYKSREENVVSAASSPLLSCPGCGNLLLDPVTAQCGHTYCRHCLKGEPRSRCRLCRGDMGRLPRRTCVLLKNVTDKWFPQVARFSWQDRCISELLEAQEYREVIRKSQEALQEEPYDLTLHVYMAEAYSGLYEYDRALEELNFVLLNQPNWPEVYSKKANVLQKMGHLYESLKFYLHCLALDEEFGPAREEIEKLLCDLLSPVPENVKESLKDPVWNSPARSPLKPFVLGTDEEPAHNRCEDENKDMPKAKDLSSSCLHRVQSIQLIYSPEEPAASESLKRVASEPLLSRKEKGIFLKRKFSFSEQDASVCEDERKKHVKQEETSEPGKYLIASRNIPEGHVDLADFECSLCMRLFYEPVTTPCGHTFCKKCLERCLDHTPQCPLCKESLTEYLATRNYNVTHMLEDLIKRYLPEALSDRKIIHEEETAEISNLTMNVPVFVCTMAYPTVPCPLHVFEPRYRLMIRRCMETGTKKFGMCISDPEKSFADHGCMLQIRNVHFLPDGRSVVDTVGGKRFRVLKRGMRDGYWTADIEYLSDIQVEDAKLQELKDLHDAVYMQACRWFQNLRYRFRSQILHHFGAMPEIEENIQAVPNGPAWCWWLLAVLPVDRRYQLSVLSVTSLQDRLLKLQHILTCFSRNQSK